MLSIKNHQLIGDGVSFRATPNHGGELKARYLVFHYTAGRSAESSVESLCTRKPQGNASAHLVLARDGWIVQLVPFNIVAWHAGVSQWNGVVGLNQASIGIEMDNAGAMNRVGDKFVAWFGKEYPASEVMLAEHKHGGGVRPWHAYTEVQIERALELAELLVNHYRLKDVLGHEDIARGRKQDPGPAFPLASIASCVLGRTSDVPTRYVVTSDTLNIRKGPDASFDPVAPPLKRGTIVLLLQPADRWSKVEVEGPTDIEGWVNNSFIALTAAVTRQRGTMKKGVVKKAPKKPSARKRSARARR
ncbi:MAG: N-acetylmuramoyl-L-alanine amidase [Burkholderiaceae bacterium]